MIVVYEEDCVFEFVVEFFGVLVMLIWFKIISVVCNGECNVFELLE